MCLTWPSQFQSQFQSRPNNPTHHQNHPNKSNHHHPKPKPKFPQDEIDEIISVANSFLAALSAKSRRDFEKHCVRAGGMSLSPPSPSQSQSQSRSQSQSSSPIPSSQLRFCTIGSFVERVSSLQADINERIWDPEVKVYDAGNLAAVWAPFRAKVDGVLDHVGVELFVLHKIGGRWKVTGLADSCRRPTEEERSVLG